uniref:F-box domain-containing protein n=1 Tax=Oryza nivara TaxID=4536 RepID=A0A0E0GY93_ORYNI
MASSEESSSSPAMHTDDGRDRLSDLPDELLGHILSFLPNVEAGRTAVLSRRWRDVFGCVDTISLEEYEGQRSNDWETFFYEAEERKSCSGHLLDGLSAALLSRRRCNGRNLPLRRFGFAFDSITGWDVVFVDMCLHHVLRHASKELHLDLRFFICPICERGGCRKRKAKVKSRRKTPEKSDDDEEGHLYSTRCGYILPRKLYSCVALKTLCVSYAWLNVPESINLPLLETMRLTGPGNSGRDIQRLISGYPRLTDLKIEGAPNLRTLCILDKRLRSFALRCCQNVKRVAIDSTELTTLAYSGAVPPESLLSLHGGVQRISSCTVQLCSKNLSAEEIGRLGRFLDLFAGTTHLHVESARMGASMESKHFTSSLTFAGLTRLDLTGCLPSDGAANAVRRILEQTPKLECLTLFLVPVPKEPDYGYYYGLQEEDVDEKRRERDGDDLFTTEDESMFSSIECLRRRVTTIYLVGYNGDELTQKLLARLLLGNALVLERVCVKLVKQKLAWQLKQKHDIEGWSSPPRDASTASADTNPTIASRPLIGSGAGPLKASTSHSPVLAADFALGTAAAGLGVGVGVDDVVVSSWALTTNATARQRGGKPTAARPAPTTPRHGAPPAAAAAKEELSAMVAAAIVANNSNYTADELRRAS